MARGYCVLSNMAAFFAACCMGLAVTAIVLQRWYYIDDTGKRTDYGLFLNCTGNLCEQTAYPGMNVTSASTWCASDGNQMKMRMTAVYSLAIATAGLGFLALVFLLPGRSYCAINLGVLCIFFGMLAGGATIGLYVFTYERYYFCEKNYCKARNLSESDCKAFFGVAYFIMVGSVAAAFLGAVMSIAASLTYCCCGGDKKDNMEHPIQQGQRAGSVTAGQTRNSSFASRQQSVNNRQASVASRNHSINGSVRKQPQGANANRAPLSDKVPPKNVNLDEWEKDDSCGYYWSDVEKLFFDDETGHFYDPQTELWFDPEAGQWYRGVE